MMEGCSWPSRNYVRTDKDRNYLEEKIRRGEKNFGGNMTRYGEKQNALIKGNDSRGGQEFGMPNVLKKLAEPIDKEVGVEPAPPNGPNQVGPPLASSSAEPMSIENEPGINNMGPSLVSEFKQHGPNIKNLRPTRWKKISREKGSLDNVSELGEREARIQYDDGKSEKGIDASRRRHRRHEIDDETADRKKKSMYLCHNRIQRRRMHIPLTYYLG
ncbi:hypothetical protein Dsin_016502 [Dipteronia sinensis]|uniref:Uncharacterized protein n=1 Tax=Dipteronia sinensis TaxID=43782 RepID=A0AAE0AD88_9ROSI|nr:hypothetical protein Dsin_016502 [Dipteronia sinensis]